MFGRRRCNWPRKSICSLTSSLPKRDMVWSHSCGERWFPFRQISLKVRPGIQRASLFNLSPMRRVRLRKVDTQLRLSTELGYASDLEAVFRLLTDVQKMLKRLRHSLTTNP